MGRIVVVNSLSLDGVMQALGRPDEDTRDGFAHGGWAIPYNDEVMGRFLGERMADPGPLLLGRRTYEDFYSYWPHQTDNPFTDVLNSVQKYVVSTTLTEPLPSTNSTLLGGDAVDAVTTLKRQSSWNIGVLGSGQLLQSLMRHGLIDEYVLLIHPLILGSGRRMFTHAGGRATLRLVDAITTTTGVVIATYRPND